MFGCSVTGGRSPWRIPDQHLPLLMLMEMLMGGRTDIGIENLLVY